MSTQPMFIEDLPPGKLRVNNRPYQSDCLRGIVRGVMSGLKSGLVSMPTGGGKTIVFSQLPRWLYHNGLIQNGQKVLVLAHRDELIEQAKAKILRVNPNAKIGIEKAEVRSDPDDTYILASVQTIGRDGSARLAGIAARNVGLIITDEAHHAAADSYQRIYQAIPGALHVGFTATPFRGDAKNLSGTYEDVLYQKTLRSMMEEGWLARARVYSRKSGADISGVKIRKGEYAADELEEAVNTPERNALIVDSYESWGEGERALVFCAGVKHGIDVHNAFLSRGHASAFIDGKTPEQERRNILQAFKDGRIKVLVNVMVLTEGFDEPLIKSVILARPTRSPLVYTQQIGRALRIPEISEVPSSERRDFFRSANIIDIADAGKKAGTMNMLKMFGIEREIKGVSGNDALEVAQAIEDAEARGINRIDTMEELTKFTVNDRFYDIPVLDKMVRKSSPYLWQRLSDESMFLSMPGKQTAKISVDSIGRVVLTSSLSEEKWVLGPGLPEQKIKDADRILRRVVPKDQEGRTILDKVEWHWTTMRWGKVPATMAQLGALKRWRVEHKPGLTKGEASLLLSRVIANASDEFRKNNKR